MTQTIRTPEGYRKLWIEADYGQGRRGAPRLVLWFKISLREFINNADLEELDIEQANAMISELECFTSGYAWQVVDDYDVKIFRTAKEARAWAYSRDC